MEEYPSPEVFCIEVIVENGYTASSMAEAPAFDADTW